MPTTATGVTGLLLIVGEEFADDERCLPSSIAPNEPIPSPHSNDHVALSVA